MEFILFIFALILTSCGGSIAQSNSATMNMLTDQERTVIKVKGFKGKSAEDYVNSTPNEELEVAIFAGGCFWGVEHLMQQQGGVISVESGYTGGWHLNPTYQDLLTHTTGHAEAVRVIYNPEVVDYETLAKLFFEIHDPTQLNRQGPDIGDQYRSEVFYTTPQQKEIAEKLVDTLRSKGYNVVTQVTEATRFYPAEEYHQDYYERKGTEPYCHSRIKRF